MDASGYLEVSAELSDDGLYRYSLSRRLSAGERGVLFVCLNPSVADGTQDDRTVRRCVHFARQWGFDWVHMGNLNAWRATDPKQLPKHASTAVGPNNREHLESLVQRCELVVAAWGQNKLNDEAQLLAHWMLSLPHTRCLGLNRDGTPKHPLYVLKTAALVDTIGK